MICGGINIGSLTQEARETSALTNDSFTAGLRPRVSSLVSSDQRALASLPISCYTIMSYAFGAKRGKHSWFSSLLDIASWGAARRGMPVRMGASHTALSPLRQSGGPP